MIKFSNFGIKFKFIIGAVLILSATILTLSFVFIQQSERLLIDALKNKVDLLNRNFAIVSARSIKENSFLNLQALINELAKKDPEIKLLFVAYPNATIIASSDTTHYRPFSKIHDDRILNHLRTQTNTITIDKTKQLIDSISFIYDRAVDQELFTFSSESFHDSSEVTEGNSDNPHSEDESNLKPIGIIYIALHTAHLDKSIDTLWLYSVIITAGLMMAGVIAAYGVGHSISKPIKALAEDVRMIASGNLEQSIHSKSGDELGQLISDVEKMRLSIRDLTENLEAKVEERTKQLEQSNTELAQALDHLNQLTEDLKKATDKAEYEREASERANRSKSEFLANMSHEIRTPMNSVIGFLELSIESPEIPDSEKKNLKTALNSAKSLLTLINDILDISKLERGKLELEERPFDLVKTIQETLQVFEIKCREKGICLSLNMDPRIKPYFIGDAVRLRQIIINLVGNSVKFTNRGWINLTVSTAPEIVKNQNSESLIALHFEVSDTGIGIPADKLEKIFDPFTQADGSTARRFGGTGLGTTISKQLVELMGGRIWAESVEGKGSMFHFIVCLKPTETAPVPLSSQKGKGDFRRAFKVLIAEDIEENITLARVRLEQQGHTVIEARNGREAIEAFKKETPDIILMDIHMPEMDGVEAVKRIRMLPSDYAPPIIALTASMMKQEQKQFIECGMNAVIGKPIHFGELFAAMENLVPEGKGQRIQNLDCRIRHDEQSAGVQPSKSFTIDGVDTQKGIQVWQNIEAYQKALLGFAKDYEHAADNLVNMIKKDDCEGAYRIAHTLKGVSGNLSVTEVFRIASTISDKLKVTPSEDLIPLIESLDIAIRSAADSIRQQIHLVENHHGKESWNISQVQSLIREMLPSFAECNPEAVEPFLNKLSMFLEADQIEPIIQKIDKFDFDSAAAETKKLAQKLGIRLDQPV